jgi:hypothetical protein
MKEQELPGITKGGVPIEDANPYPEIRGNAETAPDWEYKEEAKYLYGVAVLFKDRFLDLVLLTDRRRLPDPVISFDNLRNKNTLAAYTLVRNPQGLLYEITMNTQHYIDAKTEDGEKKKVWKYGKWAQLETLLHEQVHLWQQNFGEDPIVLGKKHTYHNKEFVDKCESLGLHPKLGAGYHTRLADGVFAQLMDELGITPPSDVEKAPEDLEKDWFKWLSKYWGQDRKGKSTLKKWCCPECGLNVRMGISGDPKLRLHTCEEAAGKPVFKARSMKTSAQHCM